MTERYYGVIASLGVAASLVLRVIASLGVSERKVLPLPLYCGVIASLGDSVFRVPDRNTVTPANTSEAATPAPKRRPLP